MRRGLAEGSLPHAVECTPPMHTHRLSALELVATANVAAAWAGSVSGPGLLASKLAWLMCVQVGGNRIALTDNSIIEKVRNE